MADALTITGWDEKKPEAVEMPWEKKKSVAMPDWDKDEMSASEAMWFAGSLGFGDTYRGVKQLTGYDEEQMAADQEKLNRLMDHPDYGGRVTAAYFGGLIADPVALALPISRLKHIGTGLKAAKKLAKTGAIGGGIAGGLGYVDPEAPSLVTGKGMSRPEQAMLGAGTGAVLGPLIGGASKWVADKYTPVGEAAWRVLSTHPEAGSGTAGALLGYNMDLDATPQQKMKNAVYGVALGASPFLALRGLDKAAGTDMRGVLGRFAIPDFRVPEGIVLGRGRAAKEAATIERDFQETLVKLSEEDIGTRKAIYKMVEQGKILKDDDPLFVGPPRLSDKQKKVAQEMMGKVKKYGREFVDFGVLDEDVYLKNIDSYMHRSYLRPKRLKFGSTGEKISTYGDEFRLRGLKEEWSEADFKAGRMPDDKGEWAFLKDAPGGNVWLRRDWTPKERVDMGEVTDVAHAFDRTGRLMANDISAYRFFRDIASESNEGKYWVKPADREGTKFTVHVSNREFPDSKAKVFGDLHGKYTTPEIYNQIKRIKQLRTGAGATAMEWLDRSGYRGLNRFWKQSKTGMNPATHMGNIMSNIQMFDKFNGNVADMIPASKSLWKKDQLYKDALDDGVFGGGVLAHEMNRGKREILDAYSDAARKFTLGDKGDKTVDRLIESIPPVALKFAKASKKWTWDLMLNAYQLEDHVFRLALYKKLRAGYEAGGVADAGIRAAKEARESFVDYNRTSPLLEILREGPLPFIAYQYGIVPKLAETAAKRPWKVAKWGLIWHAWNKMGEDMSDSEEVAKQRKMMETDKRRPILGVPGGASPMIKLPQGATPGSRDTPYLDVGRWQPGSPDIFGTTEQKYNVPWLPRGLQPSFGAAGAIGEALLGIDRFTGKPTPEGERISTLASKFLPLGLPYTKDRIKGAWSGKYSPTKDVHTPATSILSSLGIKVTPVSTTKLTQRVKFKMDNKVNELKSRIMAAKGLMEAGRISEDSFMRKRDKLMEEIRKVTKKAVSKVQ
jgi:hypothetical protein